jgi:hypothetical protein
MPDIANELDIKPLCKVTTGEFLDKEFSDDILLTKSEILNWKSCISVV